MFVVHSNRIVTEREVVSGFLVIEDGKFVRIAKECEGLTADIDVKDNRIIPGIIDTHNHGTHGYRLREGITEEELIGYLKGSASNGLTTVFPTFGSLNDYKSYNVVADKVGKFVEGGAQVGGIHSEGPFGARVGEKGVNTGYPAVDMEVVKNMVEAGKGTLKLVAIAPEVEGALDAVKYFVEHGVNVAAYHTNANFAQANAGIDAGVSVMTHLGNVMTGLHHRDVGTLGAGLLRDEAWCEIICDGLHVSLPMVEIMLKVKDHNKVMMISDNVQYASLPVGRYKGMNQDPTSDRRTIRITEEGYALSETGRLSGSTLPVIYGISNLVEKLHLDIVDVMRMASTNPAFKYELAGKGSIKAGNDADFVVISDDYKVLQTYCLGKKVYDREDGADLVNHAFFDEFWIGKE